MKLSQRAGRWFTGQARAQSYIGVSKTHCVLLTFRAGKSPTDSRFSAGDIATADRERACAGPAALFLAALWSRCRLVPQSGQACQRTDKPLATRMPQPEHVWLVNAGLTPTTRLTGACVPWRNAAVGACCRGCMLPWQQVAALAHAALAHAALAHAALAHAAVVGEDAQATLSIPHRRCSWQGDGSWSILAVCKSSW